MISVYSERDYITCLDLSKLVVLEPSRAGLYLEGVMLDLRTDTGHWPRLNQWSAPPPREGQARLVLGQLALDCQQGRMY